MFIVLVLGHSADKHNTRQGKYLKRNKYQIHKHNKTEKVYLIFSRYWNDVGWCDKEVKIKV